MGKKLHCFRKSNGRSIKKHRFSVNMSIITTPFGMEVKVSIRGAYRFSDASMSNCIISGINKVYILTQFNSALLNKHLAQAYDFSNGVSFGDGFVEVLAATQTPGEAGKRWFQDC